MIGFNPSRGIAIIQTGRPLRLIRGSPLFQSLTRDSNHSNIADIYHASAPLRFQSLTRDSNHSNRPSVARAGRA